MSLLIRRINPQNNEEVTAYISFAILVGNNQILMITFYLQLA